MRNPTDGETAIQRRQLHRGQRRNGPDGVALNLLASALTILTAIALLGAATVLGDTSAPVAVSGQHDRIIHEFYSAVNEAVRSGDVTALDRLVAPDLVFHPPSAQIAPTRAGLERYLTSIHDTVPAFQLRVDAMVSDGDRAVAGVTGGSETPGGFLGLTLAAPPSTWGPFDGFRIADRQIVELWSGAPAPVLFEPATEVRLELETASQAISFERLSASSGEDREWGPFSGARVLYVDTGTITVDFSQAEPPRDVSMKRNGQGQRTPVAPGMGEVVTAGDVLSFPAGSRYRVRHAATDAGVAAFMVALPRFHYNGPLQPQAPAANDGDIAEPAGLNVIQRALDGEQGFDPLAGVTVALGRALLPSGATIAFHEADAYLFVVVETGALVLTHEYASPWLDHLDTDGLGLVTPGEPFALHNLGDDAATIFMVTVLPRNSPTMPAS